MYRLLLLLLSAGGFWLCYLAYEPGLLSPDSLSVYDEAQRFSFTDWHAPLMALLWAPLYRLTHGPQGMLALLLLLYWGGLLVLADAAARIDRLVAPCILLFGFMPFTINFAGTLWVDVLLATSWLMCAALVFAAASSGQRMSALRAASAWALFLVGALARPNALFAAVPLGIYLFSPRTAPAAGKQTVLAILVLGTVWLGNWSMSYLLKATKTHPIHSIVTYDLAGISHFSGRNYLPLALSPDETAKVTGSCYTPQAWNEYFTGDCGFVWKRLHGEGLWGSASLWQAWFAAVVAEPAAYIQHRWGHFFQFMTGVDYVFHEGNDAEEVRRRLQDNFGFRTMRNYVFGAAWLWFFRPIFWFALAAWCLVAAHRCPEPSRRLMVALGLSSLVYLATYFFVGVASNFRYAYWAVLATGVASIVGACELMAETRRSRPHRIGTS